MVKSSAEHLQLCVKGDKLDTDVIFICYVRFENENNWILC